MWDLVGAALANALGTRVTAVDLAGCGRTLAGPRGAPFEVNRKLLSAILESDGPAILVGSSMGGALSIGVGVSRPELVRALVLCDSVLPTTFRTPLHAIQSLRMAPFMVPSLGRRFLARRDGSLDPSGVVSAILDRSMARPELLDAQVRARMVERTVARRSIPDVPEWYRQALHSTINYLLREIRSDLRATSHPTLLLHGRHDRLVPVALAREAARRRPDWESHYFESSGHLPPLESPAEFVAVLAQWARTVTAKDLAK